MKNALNSVKIAAPKTAAFDLSHDVKFSGNMGNLIPIAAIECIPGDRVRISNEALVRLAPMLAPMMHRCDVRIEWFFVPNRIIWENWETWITNGGDDTTAADPLPAHPFFKYNDGTDGWVQWMKSGLLDYMGLPDPNQCADPDFAEKVSALPFGAYYKIWQDYYRDENLQDKELPDYPLGDGDNSALGALFEIRKRCWEADYFTKALPFAQKGEPVDIPLGEVMVKPTWEADGSKPHFESNLGIFAGAVSQTIGPPQIEVSGDAGNQQVYNPDGSLITTPTTINDLRLAYRLQEWLEKNARGGTRYSEIIRAHFNVRPEDSRLQRPEYIVGMKMPMQISEVLNTTGTDEAPQGTMAGHGVAYDKGFMGKYFCTEHGYLMGIFSVMPKTCYQQGIPKHFLKYDDPTQLAWPSFANLGEQPIENREILAFQTSADRETFGYTPRYMEYKTLPSRVAGDFRESLSFWTMARIFDGQNPPVLNDEFVMADPTLRIFAVEDPETDHLWCHVMNNVMMIRALPFYGTPTF